jgi:hypothetical protein
VTIGLLRFSSPVEVAGSRPIDETVDALGSIVAEFGRAERRRPYRGYITNQGGTVQQRIRWFAIVPARVLRFALIPEGNGCALKGELTLRDAIRVPVLIYLLCCIIAELWLGLAVAKQHASPVLLLGPACSFLCPFGWTLLAVRLNREGEDQMVKALKHVLSSRESAAVVEDLLSSR